jgi:hypothetical protein
MVLTGNQNIQNKRIEEAQDEITVADMAAITDEPAQPQAAPAPQAVAPAASAQADYPQVAGGSERCGYRCGGGL